MTSRLTPPQCAFCAHLRVDPEQTCDAFPDGIPNPIWWNKADHREAFEGDNDIRWEPITGSTEFPQL